MMPLWEDCLALLARRINLKTQVTRNCATQGVLQHTPRGGLKVKDQLCHLERYSEPTSKGELLIFPWLESTYWGKRMNFACDISNRDN
jgi:hypothetical protein